MIDLRDLVIFVFAALVGAGIIALLWFAITYAESKFGGPPMFWNVIKVVFVLLIVFILINFLLELMGATPIIRIRAAR